MTKTDLLALADRMEKLEGPDREVDLAIACAIDRRPDWLSNASGEMWVDSSGYYPIIRFADTQIGRSSGNAPVDYPPTYTASIVAAMSLVPEGWRLRQMHFNAPCADDRMWHLNLWGGKVGEDRFVGRGKTPALALTAAALRARAAIEGEG